MASCETHQGFNIHEVQLFCVFCSSPELLVPGLRSPCWCGDSRGNGDSLRRAFWCPKHPRVLPAFRYLRRLHFSLKKGRWNASEEGKLLELIEKYGVGESWASAGPEPPGGAARGDPSCLPVPSFSPAQWAAAFPPCALPNGRDGKFRSAVSPPLSWRWLLLATCTYPAHSPGPFLGQVFLKLSHSV